MRKKKYILFLVIGVCSAVSLFFGRVAVEGRMTEEVGALPTRTTVLCVGLDAAAANTDVLMLLSLDGERKEISVLQIPRDTYFSSETAQKKINQLYPRERLHGAEANGALSSLAELLSESLGVRIDGYLALDLPAVAELIDGLGGVRVEVPAPIRHRASDGDGYIEIPAGEVLLGGREAVEFLRFRAGYTEGDLGRVDAQKLLLAATYRKLREEMSLPVILKLVSTLYGRAYTDMSLVEQASLARAYYTNRKEFSVNLMTLPGEPTRGEESRGLSYYVVNRKGASEVLRRYFGGGSFDPDGRFLDSARPHFVNIYYDAVPSYTVYTEETLDGMDVKIKQK